MHRLRAIFITALLVSSMPSLANPLIIGGDKELDACASLAETNSEAELKTAPSLKSQTLSNLKTGTHVFVCDSNNGWAGVVMVTEGKDCGVSSPIPRRTKYQGPCLFGWIEESKINVIAG